MGIIMDNDGKWKDCGSYRILLEPSEDWLHKNLRPIPTVEEIDAQVVIKIRERYDENEEYKMLRFGIKDPTNPDFIEYDTYAEECRAWGQAEKQRLGLIE
jgi:hypothetical protein